MIELQGFYNGTNDGCVVDHTDFDCFGMDIFHDGGNLSFDNLCRDRVDGTYATCVLHGDGRDGCSGITSQC